MLRWTIAADSTFAKLWSIVLACSWFHFLILVPLKTGFFTFVHNSAFDAMDIFMDLLLLCNAMIVAPRMQQIVQGEVITDAQALKRRYFQFNFYLDLFCSFPLDLIVEIVLWSCGPGDEGYELHLMLLRLPKLALLFKFIAHVNKMAYQMSIYVHPNMIRLTNVFVFIFLLLHWIGCGWFLLAHVQGFGSSDFLPSMAFKQTNLWDQYIYALFWALCRMTDSPTPTGAAQTRAERSFQMLVSLAGMTTYASIVGGIAHLIMNLDSKSTLVQQKMEELNAFLREYSFPNELQQKMRSYYEYKLYHDQNQSESSLIKAFPQDIQAQIIMHKNEQWIQSSGIFQQVDEHTRQALVLKLQNKIYPSNHELANIGQVVTKFILIIKGNVELQSQDGIFVAMLGPGSILGEQKSLQKETTYTVNAQTRTTCETLELTKQDWLAVTKSARKK